MSGGTTALDVLRGRVRAEAKKLGYKDADYIRGMKRTLHLLEQLEREENGLGMEAVPDRSN